MSKHILHQAKSPSPYLTGRYHDGCCWRVVLYREGRTKAHLVFINGAGIAYRAVDRGEAASVYPVFYRARSYPINRVVALFKSVGRDRGISRAARRELVRAAKH